MAHSTQPRKSPTIADVARSAGVSPATVSYVLGGRRGDRAASRISEATRDRVLASVEAIGYRVNEPARNLRRNRTDRVLLLMDRLSSPYEQHLASVIEDVLAESGRTLSIVVCTTTERLDNALGMVRAGLADGAVVQCREITGQQRLLDAYAGLGVRMVTISNSIVPNGFDVFVNDEAQAIEAAIDHLVERGHTSIGFLAHDANPAPAETRLTLARRRLEHHGLSLDDSLVWPGARERTEAFASTRAMLSLPAPPSALFSASDTGAISAIWAALSLGRRVPDDLAVVGCGNIDECLVTVPPLSSAGPVDPDFAPIARLLIDRLDTLGFAENRRLVLPWEFLPRQSS